MTPIHELLNRIRWDKEFGRAEFVIGYYDKIEDRIVRVPVHDISFEPGDHFFFELTSTDGESHSIPLHRIKELYRDGELIWHREH